MTYGGGGWCPAVSADPHAASTFYVRGDHSGIHRSDDRGITWAYKASYACEMQSDVTMNGAPNGLATSPHAAGVLYDSTSPGRTDVRNDRKRGIWRSHDRGETWSFLDASANILDRAQLAVDHSGRLFALRSNSNELYVSTDEGQSFTEKQSPFTMEDLNHSGVEGVSYGRYFITVSASNRIFVYSSGVDGLWFSDDSGDTWTAALQTLSVRKLAGHPTDGSKAVLLSTNGQVHLTTDGGSTWGPSTGLPVLPVASKVGSLDIAADGTVLVCGRLLHQDLFRSTDGGGSFEQLVGDVSSGAHWLFQPQSVVTDMAVSRGDPNTWVATGDLGVLRSTDQGATWTRENRGLLLLAVTDALVDSTDSNRILVATLDNGQFITSDAGQTWARQESGFTDVNALAQDPSVPMTFYKHYGGTTADGKNGHIYQSTDSGATWSSRGQVETTKRGPGALVVDPADSSVLYYGDCTGTYGGLWRSTDGAVSFTKVGSSPGRMCRMQRVGRWLYGTDNPNNGDLHRYDMDSGSWQTLHDGQIAGFRVNPNDDQIVFACNGTHNHMYSDAPRGQLEKTTDGGATWFDVQDDAGQDFGPWDVWIDPEDTDHMMMSAVHHDEADGSSSGVMESVDGGETWSSIRGSMPSLKVNFFEGVGGSPLANPMGIYEIWVYR